MKYPVHIYASAFVDALEKAGDGEQDILVKRFTKLLAKNCDMGRAPAIIRSINNLLIKKGGGRIITLEYARTGKSAFGDIFQENDQVKTIINSSLIAGIRITIDGEIELDYSVSRRLKQMVSFI